MGREKFAQVTLAFLAKVSVCVPLRERDRASRLSPSASRRRRRRPEVSTGRRQLIHQAAHLDFESDFEFQVKKKVQTNKRRPT